MKIGLIDVDGHNFGLLLWETLGILGVFLWGILRTLGMSSAIYRTLSIMFRCTRLSLCLRGR